MEAAEATRVPAGKALAVDRLAFSSYVTRAVESSERIRVVRREAETIDPGRLTVLASGPLTSQPLTEALVELIGPDQLYFYDAVAPIVTAESVDMGHAFFASRYDETGAGDYLNLPMDEDEYRAFYQALIEADETPARDFERAKFFEGCLPIEVMARRGEMTLAYGPMKPVGLKDPRTGRRPFAVVQLRRENQAGTLFNLVGFQTRIRRGDQDRVFRMIPGLAEAEFVRHGSVHRNTFINAPRHLSEFLSLKKYPMIFVAGQLSGVEGYVESAAAGILAGINAGRTALGLAPTSPPPTTALGGLVNHLTDAVERDFQPSNINFGLLPPVGRKMKKKDRAVFHVQRAEADLGAWLAEIEHET
jgi:methylenetetrahydrofolate--tRNA-(uracil-5-)-methyltransferase